jgi:hypothetical protein
LTPNRPGQENDTGVVASKTMTLRGLFLLPSLLLSPTVESFNEHVTDRPFFLFFAVDLPVQVVADSSGLDFIKQDGRQRNGDRSWKIVRSYLCSPGYLKIHQKPVIFECVP